MVFFTLQRPDAVLRALPGQMLEKSIRINPMSDGMFRFVTHWGIKAEDIAYIADTLGSLLA